MQTEIDTSRLELVDTELKPTNDRKRGFVNKKAKDMTDYELAYTAYDWFLEGSVMQQFTEQQLGYVNALKWEIIHRFVNRELAADLKDDEDE